MLELASSQVVLLPGERLLDHDLASKEQICKCGPGHPVPLPDNAQCAAQGNREAACKVYDAALVAVAEKGSAGEGTYAFLVVAYARLLAQAFDDASAGRSLYEGALAKLPGSRTLWEGAIQFEENLNAPVRPLFLENLLWNRQP